ncbi:MAG TPA: response regulator transcription factor [Lapillicoccus sp.]
MTDPVTHILRVVVVDDQALVRSGFSMILGVEPDLEVVGEASDGTAAVDVVTRLRPDVVLMDVQMPGTDGIEATREIVALDLAKVIILTTFDRDDYLVDGLRAGASGFLLKNAEPEKLVDAVRVVGNGHALLAPEVTRRVIERMTTGEPTHTSEKPSTARPLKELNLLTNREREVLVLIGRGLSNAEIAAELFVGDATVKTHVSNVLAKLHLRDRVQAVVLAHQAGLIRPEGDGHNPPAG